jgi:hypothetical protein
MIEYQVVQEAAMFPQTCLCGASKGPFIDTMIQYVGAGGLERRWYICRLCVKRSARPFAWMPGPKMDELENLADVLIAKEKELADAHKRNEKQTQANADLNVRIDELVALVEHYRGIGEQYKHLGGLIFENARELVSTANGGV